MNRLLLLIGPALLACAGPRAIARPADPYRNLAEARTLYHEKKDPMGAEKLIMEAIAAFKRSGDRKGLADAYHQYAYLIESPAVADKESAYRRDGFADKSVTFDNRLMKAVAYFDRAAPLYARLRRFDLLTSNSLGRGIVFANLRDREEACASFDQAVSFREEHLRRNPDARAGAPDGSESWDAYLAGLRKWAGCRR